MDSSIMNKTILAAVVLMAAAFAGVMIVGDDTDAAAQDITTVVYKVGDYSFEYPLTDVETFTVKDISDFDITYAGTFVNWKVDSVIYIPGQTISKTGLTAEAGKYTLVANLDKTVNFIDSEGKKIAISWTAPDAAQQDWPSTTQDDDSVYAKAYAAQTKAGFTFKGWECNDKVYTIVRSGDASPYTYTLKTVAETSEAVAKLNAGMTFNAVFQKNYGVAWIVDGIQIAKGDVVTYNIPTAPEKANYNFIGWAIGDKTIIVYNAGLVSATDNGYRIDGKTIADSKYFEGVAADIEFKAVFEPVQLTVTFEVGEFKSTQTVLYGEKAMKPELPAGYIAWMFGEEEFDFSTPITENITIVALEGEPATIYAVTFEIDGQTPVKLDSENYKKSIPDTAREGYAFQGWVVKGESKYVDPMTYEITGDITFVAVYKEVAPPAPAEPKFYETPMGQCAIIIAVFIVGLFFFGVFTGRIELPKFKVSRVGKDEVVEQVQEEKKP